MRSGHCTLCFLHFSSLCFAFCFSTVFSYILSQAFFFCPESKYLISTQQFRQIVRCSLTAVNTHTHAHARAHSTWRLDESLSRSRSLSLFTYRNSRDVYLLDTCRVRTVSQSVLGNFVWLNRLGELCCLEACCVVLINFFSNQKELLIIQFHLRIVIGDCIKIKTISLTETHTHTTIIIYLCASKALHARAFKRSNDAGDGGDTSTNAATTHPHDVSIRTEHCVCNPETVQIGKGLPLNTTVRSWC